MEYPDEDIPDERTVYRIMEEIGLSHRSKPETKRYYKGGQKCSKIGGSFKTEQEYFMDFDKLIGNIKQKLLKRVEIYVNL